MIIDPTKVSISDFHHLLLSSVAPRPIALASTIDKQGNVNLSPFSFFNCFSANPPILIFSPSRRVKDNTTKHTLENCREVKEVVINIVNFSMVEQASLSSTEYDKGVNEFLKSGFSEVASLRVSPPRVHEAPVAFECKVNEIIELGDNKGAGNLIICEVLLAHCKEEILNEGTHIDPNKIDLVARMGYNYYCRASGTAVFEVTKPLLTKGIGIDQIPASIRNSTILTGNNLARLGNVETLPSASEILSIKENLQVKELTQEYLGTKEERLIMAHSLAKYWIEMGNVSDAWKLLLLFS